jgi:hypothetical protein
MRSHTVISVGALCFGVAIGYVTYRTLVRKSEGVQISDLAAVISAVGGGTVTALFDRSQTDSFGWYSIGLLGGMAVYFVASLVLRGKQNWAGVMGEVILPDSEPPPGSVPTSADTAPVPDPVRPRS